MTQAIQKTLDCCAVFLIDVYQYSFSPDSGVIRYLGLSKGKVCRFEPSCSEYTKGAILSDGLIRGVFLGMKQILRCHPWGGRKQKKGYWEKN